MREVIKKVWFGINEGVFSDLQSLVNGLGLVEVWRSPPSTNKYEWISFDWIEPVVEVNALIKGSSLTRTEIIICCDDDAKRIESLRIQWETELNEVFGRPIFSGDWEAEGFPEDEPFCLFLTIWSPCETMEVLLLHRKDDDEAPDSVELVVKPT